MSRPHKYSLAFYKQHLPTAVAYPGVTIADIAKKLGMSVAGVSRILRELGIPSPREHRRLSAKAADRARAAVPVKPSYVTRMWNDRIEEVHDMYTDRKMSVVDLAAHYSVPYHTMYRWVQIFIARKWVRLDLPPYAPPIPKNTPQTEWALHSPKPPTEEWDESNFSPLYPDNPTD